MQELTPSIDFEKLQQKANEYAMKGAEEAMKEFYTGYESPYKKAITENLQNKGIDDNFDIPDIVAVLNQKLSTEVDMIANTAIAKTFVPLVKRFLTREQAEVKFSDILKKFIEYTEFDSSDRDPSDYTVDKADRHQSESLSYSFPTYQITNGVQGFELHFFRRDDKITIVSLPYELNERGKYHIARDVIQNMKISLDGGATLELPFVRGILENEFMSFCARLVIGNTNIIFDTMEFNDDMFPEDECRCH